MHKVACNLERSWYDTGYEVSACYSTQASDSSDASCKTTATNVTSASASASSATSNSTSNSNSASNNNNNVFAADSSQSHDCRFSTYDMCGHVNHCPLILEEANVNKKNTGECNFMLPRTANNTGSHPATADRQWSSVRLLSADGPDEEPDASGLVDSLAEWNETVIIGQPANRLSAIANNVRHFERRDRVPSRKERCYAAAFAISTALLLLFAALFILQWRFQMLPSSTVSSSKDEGTKPATCLTPVCVQTAAYILGAMNATANPCDDFYEYACGNWIKTNPLNDDQQAVNLFNKLSDSVDLKLHNVLTVKPQPSELPIVVHTKRFYQSCLNESAIDSREVKPLIDVLQDLRWWRVLDAVTRNISLTRGSDDESYLETLMAEVLKFGSGAIFDVWVNPDDKNSDIHSIYLEQGELTFSSRDYYFKPQYAALMSEYQNVITDTIFALVSSANLSDYYYQPNKPNSTWSRKDARAFAQVIFKVEKYLAGISATPEERRENMKQYNNITIASLSLQFPRFNWPHYFERIFGMTGVEVSVNETVVVSGLKFIQKLMNESDAASVTPEELAAYAIWRFIFPRLSFLGKKQRTVVNEMNRLLRGTVSEKSRWRTCLGYVNSLLSNIVARLFLEESHFDLVQRAEAIRMIKDVKDAFIDALNVTEWMEEETRKSAIRKAKAMQDLIGFPDYIRDDRYIMEVYGNLSLDDRFFENHIRIDRFKTLAMFKKLRTAVNRSLWSSPPTSVNAFYNGHHNQIMLPAGILQPPFYHVDFPKAINYGVIGMVIGHEITHGFDDKGRQYDERGNLRDWWSERDTLSFKQKAQCIIDQYSNFIVPEANMPIRGTATQGENIADNGGLKNAYRAYKNWVRINGEEKHLPGISMNNDQVFFISFAQVWCENRRKESLASRLMSMKHSPNRYRVLGTVSNSYEFAQAFSCPIGSPMNPPNKCSVW